MLWYSLKALSEALLMSTYNICFCGEIREILCCYPLIWSYEEESTMYMYIFICLFILGIKQNLSSLIILSDLNHTSQFSLFLLLFTKFMRELLHFCETELLNSLYFSLCNCLHIWSLMALFKLLSQYQFSCESTDKGIQLTHHLNNNHLILLLSISTVFWSTLYLIITWLL